MATLQQAWENFKDGHPQYEPSHPTEPPELWKPFSTLEVGKHKFLVHSDEKNGTELFFTFHTAKYSERSPDDKFIGQMWCEGPVMRITNNRLKQIQKNFLAALGR